MSKTSLTTLFSYNYIIIAKGTSQKMLILIINCHKKTQQGRLRFQNFYRNIRSLLQTTVYFGNEVNETIRTYDQLQDYIYDQISFRTEPRTKSKFQSLEYIIVDGSCSFAPWSQCMADALLLIRKSINEGKKVLTHGFGHFAAHYCLATKFDKHYTIRKQNEGAKQVDFVWEEESGNLLLKGQKICNSGVRIVNTSRPFADKSSHALSKGLTLSSKFDYAVFDAKSGNKILKNIQSPFGFYWKNKLFCTPKIMSQMKGDVLFQTEHGAPVAFSYKNLLAVQGLCPQFLKLIKNWLLDHTQRFIEDDDTPLAVKNYETLAFENKMQYRKILSNSASQLRPSKMTIRPQSSKFSTISFQKPAVRCSGKYQTLEQRYLHEELQKKSLNFGRSRMIFKGKLSEGQIGTYVQREPSRPASSHKFRDVKKDKWVGGKDFINC